MLRITIEDWHYKFWRQKLTAGDGRGNVLLLLCLTRGLCVESVCSGTVGLRSVLSGHK